MVDWASARAMLEDTVAGVFDVTPCQLVGYRQGQSVNHGMQVDYSRPAFDFLGTIDLQPPADRLTRHPPGDPGTPGATVSYAAVLTAHVGEWPWRPRNGDRVVSGGRTWRIEASERDGSSRPAWYLSEVKHAGG
ncbi:hypothetical protein G6N76_10970 [Rhizobium daejeonense]|uniref:Uncharacterized protein n=1 Tax=Rhizobium daejeonense TaxID=240521 RepID=A0A6M1RYP2_9HYPH|nr:hypothetical protein [Rhizobium daejeonense]NGO64199.1 hypothetical protein [Rhizobium daejeonense]